MNANSASANSAMTPAEGEPTQISQSEMGSLPRILLALHRAAPSNFEEECRDPHPGNVDGDV